MPRFRLLVALLCCYFLRANAAADTQQPIGKDAPADWIDPTTGHRVIRLSGGGGGSSLYFHQNAYTPEGDKLIFNTQGGIAVVDLRSLGKMNRDSRGAGVR